MDRFIYATATIAMHNPSTGEPAFFEDEDPVTKAKAKRPALVSWEEAIRALLLHDGVRLKLDLFELLDVRKKLIPLKAGDCAQVPDEVWQKICAALKDRANPVYSAAFEAAPGAEDFFRAFFDAPTKSRESATASVPALPAAAS